MRITSIRAVRLSHREVFASGDHQRPWGLITPQRAIASQAGPPAVIGRVPRNEREDLPMFGRAKVIVEEQELILERERLALDGVGGGLEIRLILVPESRAEVRDGQMSERSLPQPGGASKVERVINLAQHRTVGAEHQRDSDLIGCEVPQRKGSAYRLLERLGIVHRYLGEPAAGELAAKDDSS